MLRTYRNTISFNVKTLCFLAILLLSPVRHASAQTTCTYTVGASDQFTTIQAAVNQAKAAGPAGKTICIRDNKVYDEIITIDGVNGTASAPLRIVGHPDNINKPQLKRSAPNTDPSGNSGVFHILRSSYIFIQNIHITSSTVIGINTDYSDHIHVTDFIVENTWQSAVRLLNTSNSTVENCFIKNAVSYASPENYNGGFWGQAVGSNNRTETLGDDPNFRNNNVYRNCEITDSWGELMSSLRGIGDTFENNFIHHNNRVGDQTVARRIIITSLYADHADGATFRNNFLLFNHYNVSFNDENEYGLEPQGKNRTVENNLIVGPTQGYYGAQSWPWGMMFSGCEGAPNCKLLNDVIRNNTIVNTPDGGFIIYNGYSTVSNVSISNNVIVPRSGGPSLYLQTNYPGLSFSGNIYSITPANSVGMNGAQVLDRNAIFANPQALNTALYSQELDPSLFAVVSSLAGKGADVSTVGLTRKTTTAMYRGDTPPPVTPPPPTPPPPTPTPPAPSPTPCTHTPDIIPNNRVDIFDYNALVAKFNPSATVTNEPADINCDSRVDIFDYNALVAVFGSEI